MLTQLRWMDVYLLAHILSKHRSKSLGSCMQLPGKVKLVEFAPDPHRSLVTYTRRWF